MSNPTPSSRPIVLSIAGADPSSGAGLQADLLTGAALGVHVCTALTAWTVQDSRGVQRVQVLDAADTRTQIDVLLADFPIAAIKIGLIGSLPMAQMLREFLLAHRHLPLVLDPIWRAGGGQELAGDALYAFVRDELLPLAHIATPNLPEALQLTGADSADIAASNWPGDWLLISDGHGSAAQLDNRLYQRGTLHARYPQARLPGSYHGTGCTLSTAIAAGLACAKPLPDAVAAALAFTHTAVEHAYQLGHGQSFPDRLQVRP
ncbi:hydroxymethylpyrimidine/phosphomethylpyrimidine kinase [Acidithiobacillus sp. IBUN Pt1247-S3]|uniref:bifunctional hydroxymethylpyrimidine kinase/phosphomethylpyrimidine kinase n=1 Tax=Acidithiobacillus sp. IBUN Pt1247-S3 TaxID=3166642 RepID=UPI0034E5F07C